jgi:hypothetical protein
MGEAKLEPLRVDFDPRLKLEFHDSDISSDGGLFPYRQLDHALEPTELGGEVLSETRRGKNTRHLLVGLLRQSVFGRLAGYEGVNDAQRLSHDPVMRAGLRPQHPDWSMSWVFNRQIGLIRGGTRPTAPVHDANCPANALRATIFGN